MFNREKKGKKQPIRTLLEVNQMHFKWWPLCANSHLTCGALPLGKNPCTSKIITFRVTTKMTRNEVSS